MATDGLNLKSCSRGSRGWGCSSLVKERGRRSPVSACVSQKYRSTKKYTWNYKYMTWDFELSTELVRDDIIIQWAYRNTTSTYVRLCFTEVKCGMVSIECTILRWKARKSHLDSIHSNVKSTIAKKVTTRIYKNVHLQINFFCSDFFRMIAKIRSISCRSSEFIMREKFSIKAIFSFKGICSSNRSFDIARGTTT